MKKASFNRSNQMRDFYNCNPQEVTKRLQAKANEISERHRAKRNERGMVGATIEGVNECDAL